MTTIPYSIKIFLPSGDPEGIRIIEKTNWTGSGVVIPRALMAEARQRGEIEKAGVYVLIGPPEDSELMKIYVGEGDPVRPRLQDHASRKEFWTSCIAFVSKDASLNKAHVQYLESRLIGIATDAKHCVLDNGNFPALPSLSEADAAEAEGFLSEMLLCCPILGLNVFKKDKNSDRAPILFLRGSKIEARGQEVAKGFLVREGSCAVIEEVPSIHPYMSALRTELIRNGVFKKNNAAYCFTQDYSFSSPSTAAGVLLGRTANGRIEWKTREGKTLKELQEEREQ